MKRKYFHEKYWKCAEILLVIVIIGLFMFLIIYVF